MKCITNAMFLGSHSGKKEDDSIYYYGSFLDKTNSKPFNLYYENTDFLKTLTPFKDYDIQFNLYKDRLGLWKVSTKIK